MASTGTSERVDPAYASWPRRMLALVIDWFASTLVVIFIVGTDAYYSGANPWSGVMTLGVFVLESAVLTVLLGGSFGKLATGLRTAPMGRPTAAWPLVVLLRQVLVALVIPPLVFRPDGRGLHDLVANSTTVRVIRQ